MKKSVSRVKSRRKGLAKKQVTRVYNNQNRAKSADASRKKILSAFIDLLVQNNGGDVEISRISAKSGVSQRTVFRFFKDKTSLHEAASEAIAAYLVRAQEDSKDKSVAQFTRDLFQSFDEVSKLTTAYVLSSFGQQARTIMRKKLNQILLERLKRDYAVQVNRENRDRLNFVVSLISARIWYEMRTDHALTGPQSGELVSWAIETLIRDLKLKRPDRSRSSRS